MHWTKESLAAKSVDDRHTLWKNARSKNTAEAQALAQLIESCGLPYSDDSALRSDDPLVRKMIDVIYSQEAKDAAVAATKSGMPALQGVDPILVRVLGVDYGPHNRGTMEAGSIVALMMREQGYKNSHKKGPLPPSCIAKTAEIFVPNIKFPSSPE